MATTICPVCNKATSSTFCEHCGFEIHILPTTVSAEVKAYEKKRIAKYMDRLAKMKEEQEAHETTKRELEELRAEKKAAASVEPSSTEVPIPFPKELVIADKCPVCEAQMTEEQTYCEHCGWTRIIYPQVVPPAIVKMEEERLAKMKEAYQKRLDTERQQATDTKSLNEEIERQNKLVTDVQNKNKELTESNKELFEELFTTKGELSAVNEKLGIANGKLDIANKKITTAESERDVAKGNLETEKTEHDKTKELLDAEKRKLSDAQRQLQEEKNAHAATKRALEALRKAAPTPRPTPTPNPVNHGEKKGEVVFNGNGKTVKQPLYEGTNVFTAPQGIGCPISGDLFQVEVNGVEVRVFSVNGQTLRVNGREIGPKGKQVYSDDVLTVGNIKVALDLPD